jgi:hypothetical protein
MRHRFLAFLVLAPCLHAAEPNALTQEEQRQGYQLLFDGQSLQGWQLLRPDAAAATQGNWAVEEGCLVPKGRPRELMTTAEYGDFELLFDWKIGKAGNSGVLYRIEPQYNAPTSGPEYQLLDDANHPAATQYPDRRTGAAYAIYPPTDRASSTRRPAGQWNTSRILVRGNHVEHWLNGVQVLAYELHSPDWKERVSKSKFAKQPQYGRAAKGRIVLQDHNSAVWFRNLKVRSF